MVFPRRSDAWVVRQVLAGRPEAFETLVFRHQRKAFAVAQALGVPGSSLDDVVQESLLQSFRDLGRLEDRSRFGPWFLQIVRNTSYRCLHKTRAASNAPLPENVEAPPAPRPEEKDLRAYLRQKVEALPEGIRETIFLYYYQGESVREVARALAISSGAAKKRLQRGRDILRGDLWRELEETLREMLPSAREWKLKGRHLALAALALFPVSLRAAAARGACPPLAPSVPPSAGAGAFKLKGVLLAAASLGALAGVASLAISSIPGRGDPPERTPRLAGAPRAAETRTSPGEEARTPAAPVVPHEEPAVRLRVEDPEGQLVKGARVTIRWKKESPGEGTTLLPEAQVTASPSGEFQIERREGSSAIFTVGAPGFMPRTEEHDIPGEGRLEPLVITLERGPAFAGRLVDLAEGQRAVPGARVGLLAWSFGLGLNAAPRPAGPPPFDLDASSRVSLLYEVESDGDGRFSLTGFPGTIWATREGYGPTAVKVGPEWTPQPDQVFVVPMFPPTTVRLDVRAEAGEAVKGFTYAFAERLDSLPGPPFASRARGSRALHTLYHPCRLTGNQALLVEEIAFGVECGEAVVRRTLRIDYGRENRVEVVLPEAGSISGRVTGPEGTPIAGARVALADADSRLRAGDQLQAPGSSSAITDAGGNYEIVLAGKRPPLFIVAEHPEHPVFMSHVPCPPPGKRLHWDVRFSRAAHLALRMAGGREGAREGKVGLELPLGSVFRPALEYRRSVELDAAGEAEIGQVPPGVWVLDWLEGETRVRRRLLLSALPGRHYDLALGGPVPGETLDVSGTLVERGRPLAGYQLWLTALDSLLARTVSGPEGRFVLASVPPGTHRLMLLAPREPGFRAWDLPLKVAKDMEPLVLDLRTTTLTGRVLSRAGPLALVGVKLYERAFSDGEWSWRSFKVFRTAPDGTYMLPGLPEGPHVLIFRKEDHQVRRIEWESHGEAEARLPDVVLEPLEGADTLRFRVTPAGEDREVAPVSIELYCIDGEEVFLAETLSRSNPEEPLEVQGLAAGRYRALISAGTRRLSEHAGEVVELDHRAGSSREVAVSLRPGGSVEVLLLAGEGPIPGPATVEMVEGSGRSLVLPGNRTRLSFNGCGVIHGLPLELLKARIRVPGCEPLEVPVKPEAGRVTRIEAVLTARASQ